MWRARPSNPINAFYWKVSDGAVESNGVENGTGNGAARDSMWNVFWKGLTLEEAGPAVPLIMSLPSTLVKGAGCI